MAQQKPEPVSLGGDSTVLHRLSPPWFDALIGECPPTVHAGPWVA